MSFFDKEILGAASSILSIAAYIFYAHQILKKKIKPHIFSWIIWATTEGIAFFAQLSSGSGPGAWGSGFVSVSCLIIVFLSLKRGEKNITGSDKIIFMLAMSAMPLWYVTNKPLYALLLLVAMNLAAFHMTIRKSWNKPQEENATLYALCGLRCIFALLAIESISFTTIIYPGALAIANTTMALILISRRAMSKK